MKKSIKTLLIGIAIFISGVLLTLGWLYGFSWLPGKDYSFNFDTLISAIGVVGTLGAIWIVYWSTKR